jgi:hypothetical protein
LGVELKTFVIGFNSGGDVGSQLVAAESRCVAVDPLAVAAGGFEFGEDRRVALDDAGEVHHLREIEQLRVATKLFDFGGAKRRAGRLKTGSRDAGGDAEVNFAGRFLGETLHHANAFDAEDVGYLVWIGNGADGAMNDGDSSEFRRGEHRAFDMHVGIDQPGAEEARSFVRVCFANRRDSSVSNFDLTREDPRLVQVDDLAVMKSAAHVKVKLSRSRKFRWLRQLSSFLISSFSQ